MKLKIDSERVKEAAKGCPDVARALKTIFPEAFKPEEPQLKNLQRLKMKFGTPSSGSVGVLIIGDVQEKYAKGADLLPERKYTVVHENGFGNTYPSIESILRVWEVVP